MVVRSYDKLSPRFRRQTTDFTGKQRFSVTGRSTQPHSNLQQEINLRSTFSIWASKVFITSDNSCQKGSFTLRLSFGYELLQTKRVHCAEARLDKEFLRTNRFTSNNCNVNLFTLNKLFNETILFLRVSTTKFSGGAPR